MSNATLANGFSDLEIPVTSGGTNDATTLSLTFDGEDQGAKGTIDATGNAGAITAWTKVNDASRDETFRLRPRTSGYKALPAAITIDGVTVQPSIRLEAGDATVSAWTDVVNGNAFAIAGSGADPTFDEQSPGIDCKRVKFNGAKYYVAASNSVGAIGTNDFVMEVVFQYDPGAGVYIVDKIDPTISIADSVLLYASSSNLLIYVDSAGGAAVNQIIASSLVTGAYYHVIIFFDRSGSLVAYVNGTASTAASISAFAADNLAVNGKWATGANGVNGANPYVSGVSYFALWTRASWLAASNYAGVAAKRFAQCCGTYAETAQLVNPGFIDLDMEAAGTTNWTAGSGATLSKETGTRTGGSGAKVLRIAGDGSTASPRALQTKAGGITRITGWARSNGTAVPTVGLTAVTLWTGSNSTSWQSFDISVSSCLYSSTRLDLGTTLATGHVEFDDITIEADGAIPTTTTRSTTAFLEKWNTANTESYLIRVGANWIRTDKLKCADGTFKTGTRIENGQTNRLLYSEDFSNAAWTKTRVTLGTPVIALGSLNFDAIIASADNATHLVYQGVTTAASESHSFSIYAKAGAVNSIRIELNEDATQYAYYNLATGAIGATGAGFTLSQPAHIYDKGNGYYRCEFRPTTAGTTGTINIYASNGSTAGSETFTGDASTTSVYLGGAQFERQVSTLQQRGSLTSYIKTTSATATRVKDTLTFHGYENCGGKIAKNINIKIDYVCPVYVSGYTGYRVLFAVTSKNTSNRVELFRDVTNNKLYTLMSVGGVSQAGFFSSATLNFGGNQQTSELCAAKNNINIVINRAVDATDTAADLPELLEIVIGGSTSSDYSIDGIITDFLLSKYGTVYPRAILALDKDAHTQSAFLGYDMLDEDALTYELRAGAGTTRLPTMNGGTLNVGDWHLISLEWSGGTGITLRIDGASVDTATADATIAGLTDLFLAWAGLNGYIYEPASGDPDYPITFGAVSIADVQYHSAAPPAAWYTEMVARGVPTKNEHLIHQISQVAHQAETHYDFISGIAGTLTDEGVISAFVPPTEIGLALGAPLANKKIIEFGSDFPFMQETSHSFDAWIRIDGGEDQCVWANGDANTTDFQALLYDDATDSLVYKCVIGATLRSVSAEIEIDRLYHVAVTRDYDSGAGTTTLTIYLDAVPVDIQIYTGAPVVTNDNFVMLATSESGGVFTLPLIGATVGNRFYDDALTQAEIAAIYAADSAVILNGPYATQTITPATLPATISGAIKPDGSSGYPIVLVQEQAGGAWRAIASAQNASSYSGFSKQTPVNDFRLYTKDFGAYAESTSYFDELDGGEDPGEFTIGLVEIEASRRKALENIVLQRKPLHAWAVMVVRYT
jgi:hypothetical protein